MRIVYVAELNSCCTYLTLAMQCRDPIYLVASFPGFPPLQGQPVDYHMYWTHYIIIYVCVCVMLLHA